MPCRSVSPRKLGRPLPEQRKRRAQRAAKRILVSLFGASAVLSADGVADDVSPAVRDLAVPIVDEIHIRLELAPPISLSKGELRFRDWIRSCCAGLLLASLAAGGAAAEAENDRITPRGLVTEHVLEHHWSEGGLWSLLPPPPVAVQLRILVGDNYRVRAFRAKGKGVLVIWLPHAAGTSTGSEIVGRLATQRGWSVVALIPPPNLPLRGAPIEKWLSLAEERIRAGRAAVELYATEPSRCTVLMGVSLGGIAALRAAEMEERVDVAVALLAGSGEAGLLHAARAYGASLEPPAPNLISRLAALDPALHAGSLRGRPVLLARAFFDSVIPGEAFEALRDSLGDPAVQRYPTGHETFPYMLPIAVARSFDWAARACGVE